MTGKSILTPIFSSMFRTQAMCEYTLSMLRPINSHSSSRSWSRMAANAMNSVVHTGVKSAGWENRISQLPLKSSSRIVP